MGRKGLKNYLLLNPGRNLPLLDLDLVTPSLAELEVGAQVGEYLVPNAFSVDTIVPVVDPNSPEADPI